MTIWPCQCINYFYTLQSFDIIYLLMLHYGQKKHQEIVFVHTKDNKVH